jgi:hypothetical protein
MLIENTVDARWLSLMVILNKRFLRLKDLAEPREAACPTPVEGRVLATQQSRVGSLPSQTEPRPDAEPASGFTLRCYNKKLRS